MQKIKIGIIGGKGKMGQYFILFFKKYGYEVLISDLGTKLTNVELAEKCDVVIVSVPIEKTIEVIQEVAPFVKQDCLLMDLTSLKVEPVKAMLKSKAEVIGCHPMFAPTVSLQNQIIILCKARSEKWYHWLKNLLEKAGAIVKELSAQEHDELMTVIQSLTHFTDITLAHSLKESGLPVQKFLEYQSPAYRLKLDMMGRILNQDAGLYGNMQIQNPHTNQVLKTYLKSVKDLMKIVKKKDLKKFVQYFQEGADYLGDFREKAQKESDLLIETLNQTTNSKLRTPNSKNKDIAVLGPANSYSDLVAKKYTPEAKIYYAKNLREIFELVKVGKIKAGIVPIENKIEGSIRETMDLLFETDLQIEKKLVLPIRHCLAVLPETKKSEIKQILSHPQPLGQCENYIKKNFSKAEIVATSSTSEAMHQIIGKNLKNAAAIGSTESAQNLELKILAKNIGDEKENETHFYLVKTASSLKLQATSEKVQSPNSQQTSIAFYFKENAPGTLFGVLQEFNKTKLNLSRIESRPAGKKMGSYIFYLDFDGNLNEMKVKSVLEKITKKVGKLKILGSYSIIKF